MTNQRPPSPNDRISPEVSRWLGIIVALIVAAIIILAIEQAVRDAEIVIPIEVRVTSSTPTPTP